MIRPAVLADVPDLVAAFVAHQRSMGCDWEIDEAVLATTFAHAVAAPEFLCLTGDGCLLLAVSFISPLGAGLLAQELCLSALPQNRDELIGMYEDWARSRGCRKSALSCDRRHAAFARLYGRSGYAIAESTFSKVL